MHDQKSGRNKYVIKRKQLLMQIQTNEQKMFH